jgi:hypothetical protein
MRGRKRIKTEEIVDKVVENCIEWITGDTKVAITFSEPKYKSKIKELASKYPDQVDYIENEDGSIFAHLPKKSIKISIIHRNYNLTDEQRKKAAERMKKARNGRKTK